MRLARSERASSAPATARPAASSRRRDPTSSGPSRTSCGPRLRRSPGYVLRCSPDGGTVTVGVEQEQGTVEVSVADEGIGIPQSDQGQIFRKFYRGADAETRVGQGGTGLGLFIARGLVTAMGGRIWVESREGEGSTFAFELPAAGITQSH